MDGNDLIPSESAARIVAEIAAYNEDRALVQAKYRKRLLLACVATALVTAACAIAVWFLPARQSETQAIIFVVALGISVSVIIQGMVIAKRPKQRFQQAARDRLFPSLFSIVEGFRYQSGGSPASLRRMPTALTGKYKKATVGDMMTGSYSGLRFEIYEAALLTPRQDLEDIVSFQGVIAAFPLDHAFPGTFLAVNAKGAAARFLRDLFTGGDLSAVRSVDAGLDAIYEFRSTNPQAASAMLHGPLAEALTWLRRRWPHEPVRLALIDSEGFLLLPAKRDLFELPDIATELDYRRHVEPIVREFLALVTIASLVSQAAGRRAS